MKNLNKNMVIEIIHKAVGVILIISGVIIFVLPVPFGLLFICLGILILVQYYDIFAKPIRSLRTKSPKLNDQLLKYKHKFPKIIKDAIDKTTP